jgi:NAD(P)-dependent dehydrogenase (short-subunit alcohol dehydrogenase family)
MGTYRGDMPLRILKPGACPMPAAPSAKVIVVTGVTRGLGRALAESFAGQGHTVLGCGRSAPEVASLRTALGEPHDIQILDVTDDAEVAVWAARLVANYGPPDLLINNAAIINANAPLWKVPLEEFDRVIDINIKGVANVIRHFVPAMVARQSGVIVNVSSGWGRSTAPEVAPYCATKWAIEGLTRALAEELPKGMAAVPLNPGIIDTDMLRSTFGGGAGHYAKPERWARDAAPFLLKLGPKDNGRPLTVPGH